ncbi:hypothetical protein BJY04DRAFT_228326 [Aspergillus karnatakaensis]|uniref:Zn(II)2Cys6 transcription factor n=1 Tax=Aspergillus karnatakaensis TaxID=1810916 RepID=UPI003CCCCDE4
MAANALESGSPRLRDVTRKGAACLGCRRQKIRCTMPETGPPCTRCSRRSMTCEVERWSQVITESDNAWRRKMEQEIASLRAEIKAMSEQCYRHSEAPRTPAASDTYVNTRPAISQTDGTEQHWQVVMGPESHLGDIPGSCVSQISTVPAVPTLNYDPGDILEIYMDLYLTRFDHFLYRILGGRYTSLHDTRVSSPLLVASICAVSALHSNSVNFTAIYHHFTALVSKKAITKITSIDDVLALVIGAYWLNDISWQLSAAAVRMALDCQLHSSLGKALEGDQLHYQRTRLYYLVFVCDHHYSIVYGRPSLTKQCGAIRSAALLSKSPCATSDDLRITFQIEFWSVMEDIWDAFGVDVEKPLDQAQMQRLAQFNIRLDTLRAQWADGFESNAFVGNYPSKGSALYYHFARLYLFTHALRGVSGPAGGANIAGSIDREHAANSAVFAATAILRTVIDDTEVQSWLNGFHSYFHVMVAFSTVFLLKICKNFCGLVYYDIGQIRALVETLTTLLTAAAEHVHREHCIHSARCPSAEFHAGQTEQELANPDVGVEAWWTGVDMRGFDFLSTELAPDFFPTSN